MPKLYTSEEKGKQCNGNVGKTLEQTLQLKEIQMVSKLKKQMLNLISFQGNSSSNYS